MPRIFITLFSFFFSQGIEFLLEIFTTADVKCCVAAVKSRPDFISVIIFFVWSLGSVTPIQLVLRIEYSSSQCSGRERCFTLHLFSLVALEGSTF